MNRCQTTQQSSWHRTCKVIPLRAIPTILQPLTRIRPRMQVSTPSKTTATLLAIPDGPAGTNATLKIMRQLVRRYKKTLPLRQLALSIARRNRAKDWRGEIHSIWSFVKSHIRYIKDITGVETIQSPDKTLEFSQGDCDDQSVLLATLLEAIGHPTRFVALGFSSMPRYEHVLVETKIGSKWFPLETTEPWPFGQIPAHISNRIQKRMEIHNN